MAIIITWCLHLNFNFLHPPTFILTSKKLILCTQEFNLISGYNFKFLTQQLTRESNQPVVPAKHY